VSYHTDKFDEHIVSQLRGGGVGFMPTDTIYGLSCAALNKQAVERLRRLKGRDEHKPFIILLAGIEMLDLLSINKTQTLKLQKYWPGALTLICAAPDSPAWLQLGSKTLAVRIPDNLALRQLITKTGPLISTSANKQSQKPLGSAQGAEELFGGNLISMSITARLTRCPLL
jgi:L-threonylcarbamoyladenylate synthase